MTVYQATPIHNNEKRFIFLLPFKFQSLPEFFEMHRRSRNSTTKRFSGYKISIHPHGEKLFELSRQDVIHGNYEKLQELFISNKSLPT